MIQVDQQPQKQQPRLFQLNVPPPPPFLQFLGDPSVDWAQRYHSFQTYLHCSRVDALSDMRKKALLEHWLGTEGQRILATLPTAASAQQLVEADGQPPQEDAEELLYRNVVDALHAHFGSHVTVITERHRFRQRRQAQGETIRQFIALLRQLATRCKF